MAVITISRMYGSGGSEIAERVARALGWPIERPKSVSTKMLEEVVKKVPEPV